VRRDEIELVWVAGRDAVVALIEAQAARIDELVASNGALAARVEELERQVGRSSRNSSLPPSRDSPDARKQRPKKQSGCRQGGQPGHPGKHREMVADPDRVVEHWPSACAGCGEQISDRVADGDPVAHQVSEIIVRVEITSIAGCACAVTAGAARWPSCPPVSPRARSDRRSRLPRRR